MNKYSSILKNKAQGTENNFELLEWPRPVRINPLTHTGATHELMRKKQLTPILIGEYESFRHSKINYINWLKLCNVTEANSDKITQASISLKMNIKTFGHKINTDLLENWANTLEKNWPKKLPRNEKTREPIITFPGKYQEKIIHEYGHFLKTEKTSLQFILNKEIKIFLRFINKRSLYDNLSAIIRICWHARKELGIWSRTWFDELILVIEQVLDFRNNLLKIPNKNSILLNNNTWLENILPEKVNVMENKSNQKANQISQLNLKRRKQLNELELLISDSEETLEDTNVKISAALAIALGAVKL